MQTTTPAFQDAIYGTVRRVFGRVTFDITDVTANADVASATTSAQAAGISDPAQLYNKVRTQSYNFGTMENNRFKLDGSFSFPDSTLANNGECGFVSSALCDADGVFATAQTVTITFGGLHSSAGLTITFDKLGGEYATDFILTAYDASNTIIDTVTVTGNTEIKAEPLGQLANYKKIVISITKWSHPFRRARVTEVDFGIVREYEEKLVGFNLVEEMRLTADELPSPELTFTVDNLDRAFNILNPTGFYAYLQQRQMITAELGLDLGNGSVEWVPMGTFLLREWKSNEGSLTAAFTARPLIDTMDAYDYEKTIPVSTNLQALAEAIFAVCGITKYSIDPALAEVATNGIVTKTSCKNVLQMIAIAGRCRVYTARDGTIVLKQDVSYVVPTTLDEIRLDDSFNEPKITLSPRVASVSVSYWTDASASTANDYSVPGVTAGDRLRVDSNKLINTSAQAAAVAAWIAGWKNAARANWVATWRGNPAHEMSDPILLDNTYNVVRTGLVTKNSVEYKGYLSAVTELQGGIG